MSYSKLKLKEMHQGEEIILYGAGKKAENYIHLLRFFGFCIKLLVVSDSKNAVSELCGVKVVELSELKRYTAKLTIVLALDDIHHENVIKNIEATLPDWKVVLLEYIELFRCYCDCIFRKNKIDLSKKYIKIGDMEIKNIFDFNENNILTNAFFFELPDLIFPSTLNEVDFVAEGSYEFGNVQLNEGDVVVDVGANIGLFTSLAASKGCSEIFAFEPVEENINYIQMISEKYMDRIHIIRKALSDTEGQSEFIITKDNMASIINENTKLLDNTSSFLFSTTTLDTFVEREGLTRVDFIKADIEGAERLLLKGAKKTLRDFAPKLALCTYHLPDDKTVLEQLILEANPNYVIEHHWKKIYAHVPQ